MSLFSFRTVQIVVGEFNQCVPSRRVGAGIDSVETSQALCCTRGPAITLCDSPASPRGTGQPAGGGGGGGKGFKDGQHRDC